MRCIRWRGSLLLFVAASSWPLQIWAANFHSILRPERILGILVVAWSLGVGSVWLLTRVGVSTRSAEYTSFVGLVFVMNGGAFLREFGVLGAVLVIVCPALACWLLIRFAAKTLVDALIWAAACALAAGPVLTLVHSWPEAMEPSMVHSSRQANLTLSPRPDIFLVVLDGYPGAIGARQDSLAQGKVDARSALVSRGFEVPLYSWSSYWTTSLSISSLLDMGYPVVTPGRIDGETKRDLRDIISGNNAAVDTLGANGYTTHMVESGWSGASCSDVFDHCIPSPLIDEATYLTLRQTIAWSVLHDSPGPYVLGTLSGFDWLLEHGPALSRTDAPDFVFIHVVSPHPPLLLRSDCSYELAPERTGGGFNLPGVDVAIRSGFLTQQIDCLERLMTELADAISRDDVLIFVSDHGTDRRFQANPHRADWSREAIVERLNNFLAVRLPAGCTVDDPVIVPNILRVVFGCLSATEPEPLPERMWVNPMDELDEEVVHDLMGIRLASG